MLVHGKPIPLSAIDELRELPFDQQTERAAKLGILLNVKRAKVGMAKHVRVRPQFDDWSLQGSFQVLAKELTDEVLEQIFAMAGTYKGLGDWRPGSRKPGRFGIFRVEFEALQPTTV